MEKRAPILPDFSSLPQAVHGSTEEKFLLQGRRRASSLPPRLGTTKFATTEGVGNAVFEDFGPRKTGFSSTMVFSPTILAKEDIEGMKGNEGSSSCGRLSSVGISFLGISKPGKGLPSEGTLVLSSSIPFISSSTLYQSLLPASGPLISQPNPWKES